MSKVNEDFVKDGDTTINAASASEGASDVKAQEFAEKTAFGKKNKMKILMALDNSGYKQKIIQYSINLARALNADVVAVHVITKASLGTTGDLIGYYRGGKVETYLEELKKGAEKLLDEAKDAGKVENVKVSTAVLTESSSAADNIIHYAKEQQVDLITIGTKGMTGIEKFLIGSVASNVIIHAHCPVLAIR